IGRNYRPTGRGAYIGARPLKASVQSICRKISAQTAARHGVMTSEEIVRRLNWMLSGWANYYHLGQVSPAYAAIDAHATKRLRQWLCRKHKVRSGKYVHYPDERLWQHYGLMHLAPRTKGLPWAKA
ncbi:group II intron maturase-specific domain-containing protein, partial [Pseudovibrio sp. POLY-S9]|uniref:group II intron maturase-specific domain-containing protein n=1 Tax=Pseudovibrio sp. POLY-S9 TaxID=1576596 RepID=UPI000A87D379